ncbi:MAG: hypothetical protein HFH35_11705 [Eubacterium sp.]|nr:hypothetical protein [Eubacterium sp.]
MNQFRQLACLRMEELASQGIYYISFGALEQMPGIMEQSRIHRLYFKEE